MDDATLTVVIGQALGRVPGWEWRTTGGQFPPDVVGIFYGAIPAYADQGIGIRVYDGDDPDVDARTRNVQIRFRGEPDRPDGAERLADPAHVVLAGLTRVDGISGIRRTSFSPLGRDDSSREQRTDNYLIVLDNTEASS